MIWVVVWVVLAVGTVVGGFFLVRHLVRSGKALMTEIERATEAVDRLERRAAELEETVAAANPVRPVALDDLPAARRQREEAAEVMAARAVRRDERRAEAFRRWFSFSR